MSIEEQLQGAPMRGQEFHKQGANGMEVEQILARFAKGESAEQISSDLQVCIETVRSFEGKASDASNFEAMKANRQKATGVVEAGLAETKVEKPANAKASKKTKKAK